MIVDPDFLDHWKTLMLVDELSDASAPMYVLRIWAHCQNRRTNVFDNLSAAALKALCRYPGHANKLESSLAASGFVRREEGSLIVCGWDEYNASLIANWQNGKKGGRPAKGKGAKNPNETLGLAMGNPNETDKIGLDKRREEKESAPDAPTPPDPKPSAKARPSTKAEVVAYCFELMLPPSDGEYMWDHWTGNGFSNGGKPIRDWRAVMRTRKAGGYMPSQKAAAFPPRPSQQLDHRPVKSPPMAGAS